MNGYGVRTSRAWLQVATAIALLLQAVSLSVAASAVPRCFGKVATIVGSKRNDRLEGTPRADVMVAGDGHDVIRGLKGNDRICGGRGSDRMEAGPGDDRIHGGPEPRPSEGDLLIYATASSGVEVDLVRGTAVGEGTDRVVAVEDVRGSGHDDVLLGDGVRNFLRGGGGDDLIEGRADGDVLVGGADRSFWTCAEGSGNDVLDGGDGPDFIHGCDGADRIVGGRDTDFLGGGSVDMRYCCGRFSEVFGGNACGQVLSGNDRLEGGVGSDLLLGCDGDDVLDGGAGLDRAAFWDADSVVADLAAGSATGEGTDALIAVEGLSGSSSGDTLIGDSGDNLIDGGPVITGGPSDTQVGGHGNDTISGGPGGDELFGGVGDDRLHGGPGIDMAIFYCGYFADSEQGFLHELSVDLAFGAAGGDGADTIAEIEDVSVKTQFCNEIALTGDDGANRLIAGDAPTHLAGGGGDDVLLGGDHRDALEGEEGNDSLVGGRSRDRLDGGAGIDVCLDSLDVRSDCEAP